MSQLITIQIGQAGNSIGEMFWNQLCREHNIGQQGTIFSPDLRKLPYLGSMFSYDNIGRHYAVRAVPVDLDPEGVRSYEIGEMSGITHKDRIVHEKAGSGNNYAIAAGTRGKDILKKVADSIRTEAEDCDSLQAFNIIHALSGGTGSGLTSLVIKEVLNNYPKQILSTTSIFPSCDKGCIVVEPYNAVLTYPYQRSAHQTFVITNQQVNHICKERQGLATVNIGNVNRVIANTLAILTTTMRYPGYLNSSFRKFYTNLVPIPSLHMLAPNFAPAKRKPAKSESDIPKAQIVSELVSNLNSLTAVFTHNAKYISVAGVYSGIACPGLTENIPIRMAKAIKDEPETTHRMYLHDSFYGTGDQPDGPFAAALVNTTGINKTLQGLLDKFSNLYARKAFVHWFTDQGMEKEDFDESCECLVDTINAYENVR